jgi:hypothetical protein
MTTLEARKTLQLFRPGSDDASDTLMAEALELAKHDPQLDNWLEEQNRFQTAMREKFREIPVPANLKESILAQSKIIRPVPWWSDPVWMRAAASIVLLIGLSIGSFSLWKQSRVPNRFANYEARMVRSALREYHMDIVTNDLNQVRNWMASKGAPWDFSVPKGLARLPLTGGGVLRWRNHPVSMMCFDRGDSEMLFLFVMNRSAVKDPPAEKPELDRVNKLVTASWTEGDKTYLLAGPEEANFLQKYQ